MVIRNSLLLGALFLVGCVNTQYTLVDQGPVPIQSLEVTTDDGQWNRAPGTVAVFLHKGSELWTRDGPLLDRLLILGGIENGQTLFVSHDKNLVYPMYKNGMLPNEIVELTEDSLTKLLGAGAVVQSSGLRPTQLDGQRAVMFNLTILSADEPARAGRVLSFVSQNRLYLLAFIAAELYYFDKHWQAAESLMRTAHAIQSE